MKVRMLKTVDGAENGHTVQNFKKGEIYDLGPNLAELFSRDKVVEIVREDAEKAKTADEPPAPINLEKMKKDELVAYAKANFDITLEPDIAKAAMIAAIEDAEKAMTADAAAASGQQ